MGKEEEVMVMGCVKAMARMHASTWNSPELLKYDYLGACDWIKGEGKEHFEKSAAWNQGHQRDHDYSDENEFVTKLLEAQNTRLYYEDYVAEL